MISIYAGESKKIVAMGLGFNATNRRLFVAMDWE
jgi:hypothetical protein